jgi:cytidine deaminase
MAVLAPQLLTALAAKARLAAKSAYCPYSQFPVGAAILADNGEMYIGCNVENVAYGSVVCAEITAITSAIAHGAKAIKAVVLYTPTAKPTLPCGNCRQIIHEFAEDLPIITFYDSDEPYRTTLRTLLPDAFAQLNPTLGV